MTNYTNVEIDGFRNNLVNAPQQMKSRLLPGVTADLNDSETGLGFSVDILKGGEGPKPQNVKGKTREYRESGQTRRYAFFSSIGDHFHVNIKDVKRLIADPTQRLMKDFIAKKEKQRDIDIYAGMFANAFETDASGNPTSSVSFPAAQTIAADFRDVTHDTEKALIGTSGDLGITMGKLIKAKTMLMKSEIEGEIHMALPADAYGHLLASAAATNNDYAAAKALVNGEINYWMGIYFHRFEHVTTTSSIMDLPVWVQSAVEYRERPLENVTISTRHDLELSPEQFAYSLDRGFLRVHDTGVVKLRAHINRIPA